MTALKRLDAAFVQARPSQAVMQALGDAWFVGGCVRDALYGLEVADVDMATPLLPEEVIRRLEAAGIRAIPTGLSHGTVTAVAHSTPIEITTFRADVATHGRHADVAFTDDMSTDASRRDFTMNALYADAGGHVVDPLGGLPDLLARKVRFIGDPRQRIREDYLRILRFFRFHVWYGAGEIDAAGLAAVAELACGIEHLARERIGWEFRRILAAPDPVAVISLMEAALVLERCLPGADPSLLAPLLRAEGAAGVQPDWLLRLAALDGAEPVAALRLSRAEAAALAGIRRALADDLPIAQQAYRHGEDATRRAALLRGAASGSIPPELEAEIARGAASRFPLQAADLIAGGMAPGPELGQTLSQAETKWLASDFTLEKCALLGHVLPYWKE